MKKLIAIVVLLLLSGCASAPYVTQQRFDEVKRTKTERICTKKTYVIPFYVVIAAGFFTFEGDETCEEVTTTY